VTSSARSDGTAGPAGAAALDADVVVVGAGIVGLAVARAWLARHPDGRAVVVDKEDGVAAHQSGRNSGVIHAGVYYAPGSTKARLCREGRVAMLDLARRHGIAHEVCGKVVVATRTDELDRLAELERRCAANGLAVERLDRRGLQEREPHAAGVAALHVPATGIIDYRAVCDALVAEVVDGGGELRLGWAVDAVEETGGEVTVQGPSGRLRAGQVVNCAGAHSDELANGTGRAARRDPDRVTIVPVRGEYYELVPHRRHLVRNLIYPVPDPDLPFLGVHFTRDIGGGVHAGPNAVPALGREAYGWRSVDRHDVAALVAEPGVRRVARRYWRTEVGEIRRSLHKGSFVAALQRLVPEVRADDLVPAPAGIRAQAVDADGRLLDDFAFRGSTRVVHVVNAPSPAATASLAIAEEVVDRLGRLAG
jgi:L-2-hydroxyglutarate oxidase